MKTGMTLDGLTHEVQRIENSKRDFAADTRNLSVKVYPGTQKVWTMAVSDTEEFTITEHTHEQISDRLGIPRGFYRRLSRDPFDDKLADLINTMHTREPEVRMVRTLDGNARAYLSNRYRRLDNYDLCKAVIPTLQNIDGLSIESCNLSESRLYIKASVRGITREVAKVGDTIAAGIVISNSEIGMGSVKVEPFLLDLSCLNGATINKLANRRAHIGRSYGDDGELEKYLTDETLQADDHAFWLKVRDTINAFTDADMLEHLQDLASKSAAREIRSPIATLELTQRTFSLTDNELEGITRRFMERGQVSAWGLSAAVTRHSQDIDCYDRATQLERIGGNILTLDAKDWDAIANPN